MYKIAVVILHYENLPDTQECVDSLIKQQGKNFDIIVVDNGSKTGSVDQIERIYSDRKNMHFLRSKENLGFARGNN